jgi:RNA-binding protein
MALRLTASQRARLKAKAHSLEPVVTVGQAGVSDSVIAEVERSLTAHELIKVKLAGADRDSRREIAAMLSERTGAAVARARTAARWRSSPTRCRRIGRRSRVVRYQGLWEMQP